MSNKVDLAFVNNEEQLSLANEMTIQKDEVLEQLKLTVDPVIEQIDDDVTTERAVLVLGTTEVLNEDGEYEGLETYMDQAGDLGLLQQSLYEALVKQINGGKPALFQAIREVVQMIEKEKELDDQPLLAPFESRTLH